MWETHKLFKSSKYMAVGICRIFKYWLSFNLNCEDLTEYIFMKHFMNWFTKRT